MDIKFRRFIGIAAIITLFNGVCYTLFPAALLPNYGIAPTAGAQLGFRFLGAALLTFGLILWFLRLTQDKLAARGLLIGASVGNVVGLLISLWATLTGVMNGAGWLFVVTYAVLLAGYVYFLWTLTHKTATH
jgi:hypothetical protein